MAMVRTGGSMRAVLTSWSRFCSPRHLDDGIGHHRDLHSFPTRRSSDLSEAAGAGALVKDSADARRVQAISQRLIAQAPVFRPAAAQWAWEVSLIDSKELNANCGPGGKIMVYTGLIEQLQLSDDELAAVIGHEIAHALREHSREALSRAYGVQMATQLGAALGVGEGGLQMANL